MDTKWVINDNKIMLGCVSFHRYLSNDNSKTTAGGEYWVDNASNTIYFFGKSEEFGQATRVQFEAAIMRRDIVRKFNVIIFSEKLLLSEVLAQQK